jgi:hypothetical protein
MFFILTALINLAKFFNYRNPGPFNGFNFPGAPQPIVFMENFMSCASATTAVDRMFVGTWEFCNSMGSSKLERNEELPIHFYALLFQFKLLQTTSKFYGGIRKDRF